MQIFDFNDFQQLPIQEGTSHADQLYKKFEELKNKLLQFIDLEYPGIFINTKTEITGWPGLYKTPDKPRLTFTAAIGRRYSHYPQLNVEITKDYVSIFIYFIKTGRKTDQDTIENFDVILNYYKDDLTAMGNSIKADISIKNGESNIRFDYEPQYFAVSTEDTINKIKSDFRKLIPIYKFIIGNLEKAQEIKEAKMIKDVLLQNKQIIITGPPGTGKTFRAKRLAAELLGIGNNEVENEEKLIANLFSAARFPKENGKGAWAIIQFHPAYNYEDFVRGIVVTTEGGQPVYQTENKILCDLAEKARGKWEEWKEGKEAKKEFDPRHPDDSCPKFVLIIDEINRAHLAAVMGELIYALEYRGSWVHTPYKVGKDNSLTIPPNLYIIGTMNTADRSIGHIDYAVRRRFAFVPFIPDPQTLKAYYLNPENKATGPAAEKLFKAVADLFQSGYLARDFYPDDVQVGHTYFMAGGCEELAMKFAYQVYPLLREYYKDGILREKDAKLALKIEDRSINIKEPEAASQVYRTIIDWCSQASGVASPSSQETEETVGAQSTAPVEQNET